MSRTPVGKLRDSALVALLILAGAEFLLRGPARFIRGGYAWNDISQVYVASRAWLKGENPYQPETFSAIWKSTGGSYLSAENPRTHSPHPVTTLVLMVPVALLSWSAAQYFWVSVQVTLVGLMMWALLSSRRLSPTRAALFLAIAIGLAPFHTGIATGNVAVAAAALCILGIVFAQSDHPVRGGVLLALGACLKPQLAVGFIVYYLLRRNWRAVFSAALVGATILLIGIIRLQSADRFWLRDYLQNAQDFVARNRVNDFTDANPIRFTLINLQVPFYAFLHSRTAANWLALGLECVLCGAWIWYVVRQRQEQGAALLSLSAVAVLTLLPVYHRTYDAVLLVVPLYWSLTVLGSGLRRTGILTLTLIVPFLVPGSAILLAVDGLIPARVQMSSWWNVLVMPHEVWALLLLAVLLLFATRKASSWAGHVCGVVQAEGKKELVHRWGVQSRTSLRYVEKNGHKR